MANVGSTFRVTLTGRTPLLMHADNLEWADELEAYRKLPASQKNEGKANKAGDDRSPAWSWIGCLYHDGKVIALPLDNIMRVLMDGGALVPSGKRGSLKSATQSGLMVGEPFWPLLIGGKPVEVAPIMALRNDPLFTTHQATAKKLGFELFPKRVRIGQSKHVRVRPKFDQWSTTGTVIATDSLLADVKTLQAILDQAGCYKGLGDWRPGSRTPGPFGMFKAKVEAA